MSDIYLIDDCCCYNVDCRWDSTGVTSLSKERTCEQEILKPGQEKKRNRKLSTKVLISLFRIDLDRISSWRFELVKVQKSEKGH